MAHNGSAISSEDRQRRRWRFAGATLDERSLELIVDGSAVALEKKPFEVLLYLLHHAGEVCTKDELLLDVWPGRVLSDTVLTKCIGRLREVLSDSEQTIIRTAYGFGYRLVAPVTVETCPSPEAPRLNFRPGDHPPGRPLWSLIERLGVGGHGEAWRARHDKTNEHRVFKFALDEASLGALKREITLFRIINDSLGEATRVVRLLDWNLEQVPYFIEAEYVACGSLLDWAAGRGGINAVPIADRLELIARVASALAAVHAVGVLHKDLKPSNVLVRPDSEGLGTPLLADFGSGGVLDFVQLERLGITRLGFTRTVAGLGLDSVTPMYLAPEILTGQPFTVKADIYALGVMLYQVAIGDLRRVMSPGWERSIDDEILREDIAILVEGNPAERLGDADSVATRLRTLEERRQTRLAEREAHARADQIHRQLERAKARRFGLVLAFVALICGLLVSTVMYFRASRAQQRAEVAAAHSKAVTDFLSKDVFAPVSSQTEPVKDMTVIQLLQHAGEVIDRRFATQPDTAAELHYRIGRSFVAFYENPMAVNHFRRVMELGQHLSGKDYSFAPASAAELVQIDHALGVLPKTLSGYSSMLDVYTRQLPTGDPVLLELRLQIARGRALLGQWTQALPLLRQVMADANAANNSELFGRAALYSGELLIDLADPRAAEAQIRIALPALARTLGEKHELVAEAKTYLGKAFADSGRFDEAQEQLRIASELGTRWAPSDTWTAQRPRFFTALMHLQQDEPEKAEHILADLLAYADANEASYSERNKGFQTEVDETAPIRFALGEALARQGKLAAAETSFRNALEFGGISDGPHHPDVLAMRLALAGVLVARQADVEARALLASVPHSDLSALPPEHPIAAQWYRVQGLLALQQRDTAQAHRDLETALHIYEVLYGPRHWRTLQTQHELTLTFTTRARSD